MNVPFKDSVKKILAFDLDGTLIRKNSSFSFCKFLFDKKIFSIQDFIFCTYHYIKHRIFNTSLLQLHQAIFYKLFKGKSVTFFHELLQSFLDLHFPSFFYLPALERLKQGQQRGDLICILSNSPKFIVESIAKRLNVNFLLASEYSVDEKGCLCEIVQIVDGALKASFLNDQLKQNQLAYSVAYSDSFLDLPFLLTANEAIAVLPDRILNKTALKYEWEIL